MKQIGKVKFFAEDKGFGFITCEGIDVFIHQSVSKQLRLKEGDWVVCSYEPSRKHVGKYTAVSVATLNEEKEFLKQSFQSLPEAQRKMLFQTLPVLIDEILTAHFDDGITQQVNSEVEQQVRSFDLDTVIGSITGCIYTSRRKKPGDDDSFSASVGVGAAKTEDAYIDNIMPRYSEVSYSDHGFYSCYSMEDDYNRDYRAADEARLPTLVEEVKQKFRLAYNHEDHHKYLVVAKLEAIKQQARRDLFVHGTTKPTFS
ncbi:cold shock domain-containing protein [Hymenobacter sp. 102]|uniref:cold shock domain-containing protein n=1 Tax=Hymenobacter sp. 102 TaxID=3403152 RepID=UPI003CF45D60